uniref:Eukaryotic translation initiation factor 3 subunit I n=1 Tax=Panagrellus redivivus TaxID=6233 RepID=A0A7E4VVP0_PANRE
MNLLMLDHSNLDGLYKAVIMKPLSLKGHDRALTRVRLNREGDLLFSCSKSKSICVWFTDNGERLGTYDGHGGAVWDVDVSWDTKNLVSSAADNTVKLWDVQTGKNLSSIPWKTVCRSVSLSYSGNLIAYTTTKIAMEQETLRVLDIRDSAHMQGNGHVLHQPLDSQSKVIFSHLDDTIMLGNNVGVLTLYDVRANADALNFNKVHNYAITDLQISNDQGFIISSSVDKTAKLHDAKSLENLKTYKSGRPVNSAAISPTRDHIVLGGGEEAIHVTQTSGASGQFEAKLYHLVFEEEFARFKGHFGPINSIAFHPSGNCVISGGEDGYIRIQELDPEYAEYEYEY